MHPKSIASRCLALACFVAVPVTIAHAQTSASDSVPARKQDSSICHRSPLYTVVEVPRTNAVGFDHFIGTARRTCHADSLAGDFVVRNEWAEYFGDLRGHFLILDSGTGSDIRGLLVFDLRTRQRTFTGSYADLEPGTSGDTLGVWKPYNLEQPRPGCPLVGGLGAGVDSLVWLDMRLGRTRFAGRVRCATRQ